MSSRYMKDKQKVTLYVPQELHHQLKIRAALDFDSMSGIAEKAIHFYLNHSEVVDELEMSHGRSHQVYSCPECNANLVMRGGDMEAVSDQPGLILDVLPESSLEESSLEIDSSVESTSQVGHLKGDLVPC